MTIIKMVEEIRNWFRETESATFELPDGFFGDIRDGGYCLKNVHADEDKLFIEIVNEFDIHCEHDPPMMFIFQGSLQIRIADVSPDSYKSRLFHPIYHCLEIYGFQSLVLQWHREPSPYSTRFDGKPSQPEDYRYEYDEGSVLFISKEQLDEGFIG